MNEDLDREMKEFGDDIADNLGYSRKDYNTRGRKSIFNFKPQRKTLILGGAGILLLIILIALFSGDGSELSKKDLTTISARVDLLEKRLTRLEEVQLKIASLEKHGKVLQQSIVETDRSTKFLEQRLDTLIHKLDMLEKGTALIPEKTEVPTAIQKRPLSLDKKRFHEVRSGETLYRIAKRYGLSVDELCRLNNITPNQVIHPGQKLLVTPGSD